MDKVIRGNNITAGAGRKLYKKALRRLRMVERWVKEDGYEPSSKNLLLLSHHVDTVKRRYVRRGRVPLQLKKYYLKPRSSPRFRRLALTQSLSLGQRLLLDKDENGQRENNGG